MGEVSGCVSKTSPKVGDTLIAGYPDDEGIALNQGRLGASQGPDAIRQCFYKISLPSQLSDKKQNIVDIGNLNIDRTLADRHERVSLSVEKALRGEMRWVGLGGGHDYGYPDGAGFLKANETSENSGLKPLVINFDAHLDVRSTDQGLSSGTPFYRLLTEKDLPSFDFFEVGIQRECNSQDHIEWVQTQGGRIIFLEEFLLSAYPAYITFSGIFGFPLKKSDPVKKRPTFLSVDIDCFSSAYAMGCSQSWPTGFVPNELLPLFQFIYEYLDVQVLGVYEVSPPLDQDGRTAKLAAQIIHQFINPYFQFPYSATDV